MWSHTIVTVNITTTIGKKACRNVSLEKNLFQQDTLRRRGGGWNEAWSNKKTLLGSANPSSHA